MVGIERLNLFNAQRFRIQHHQPYPVPRLVRECVLDIILGHFALRPLLLFGAPPCHAFTAAAGQKTACMSSHRVLTSII